MSELQIGYDENNILENVSINCVIFGFDGKSLKVIVVHWTKADSWMLPGGFIFQEEDVIQTTNRILKERTGLSDIYLKQFDVFGHNERAFGDKFEHLYSKFNAKMPKDHWLRRRYVCIGYYALVDISKVVLKSEGKDEICLWMDVNELPKLDFDHSDIYKSALKKLEEDFITQHIGLKLLHEEFTIQEVQELYEAFLKTKFVRSNFQRKMLSLGILERKEKMIIHEPHKAPYLYSYRRDWAENYHLFK